MNFEKLGAFYLGRHYDTATCKPGVESVLYDAKDLTTHAVCLGMTGSGKTGLCVSLLEEAAIDGIPVIAIDPKGDLGNLLLTFPKLAPAQFEPWIDPGEATRKGATPKEYADNVAKLWKGGLADWGQDGKRIQRLRDSAEFSIYTPGSNAGLPLNVLKSFAAPPPEMLDDVDTFRERIRSAASGLCTLVGLDADPLRSREHILIANILDRAWRDCRDLAILDLIREIQDPPFERLGAFDVESFFPAKDRFGLAMSLNNLLASPGFASWMEGEPLDVQRLLWNADGKPRVSILSIAHLSDAERMFFVTMLLNEVVSWMRAQSGTTSLRAILYMDEVFGFLPPTANPPSKTPMLTLLKQARAFGLGCVLATQNPVDLDYKALSNAGTWFLGRLQTERDKMRVLDGLESVASESGTGFDRKTVEATLSSLDSRCFLMNNVHEDEPVLFHTRWAMSYLRGPLTRTHIQTLMDPQRAARRDAALSPARRNVPPAKKHAAKAAAKQPPARPTLPPEIDECYLRAEQLPERGETLVYRPALFGQAQLHFVSTSYNLDQWDDAFLLAPVDDDIDDPWTDAETFTEDPGALEDRGEDDARYGELPAMAVRARTYKSWATKLKNHVYRTREVSVFKCKLLKAASQPGVTEGEFRAELRHAAREQRDLQVEKLRDRFEPKMRRLQDRIQRAEQRVEREQAQYSQRKMESALSIGETLLGAIFGRKRRSRVSTTVKSVGRAARERGDIARAKESLASLRPRLAEMERDFQDDVAAVREKYDVDTLEITERTFRPRKSDIAVEAVRLVWTPWRVKSDGIAEPLFD